MVRGKGRTRGSQCVPGLGMLPPSPQGRTALCDPRRPNLRRGLPARLPGGEQNRPHDVYALAP